jgi:CheY-like chemotaxis protein
MQLLLVGDDDDFSYLRDLLSRPGDGNVGLDHAHSTEEALARLGQTTYDLLLCEYKSGDGAALRLLHEVRRNHPGAPVIFLSDHMDEATVDAALKAGAGEFARTSIVIGRPSPRRSAMPSTSIARNGNARKQRVHSANCGTRLSNRQTWVMITDREGIIESGDVFVAEKTMTPLRDNDGRITHFVSNDRDITDRRRMENQLQQAQKMDAIEKLAGGVATISIIS